MDKTLKTEWALDQSNAKFHFPNAQLPQCGSVCDTFQSQTSIVCISSSRQSVSSDRHFFLELESSCLCISSFCSNQDTSVSVQNSSYCSSLAPTSVVLRGTTITSISSSSSSALSKTTDTSKRKVSTSKSPITRPSHLGVIKQSIRDKKFSQNVADSVSKKTRTSTQKVYDAKWIVYSKVS